MRVITGSARGRKLRTLEGKDVRPTTDMVKEAMFSIIQFDIEGRKVLDLFAGCGQLGIEAISRGADFVTFVDKSKQSIDVINDNLKTVGFAQNSKIVNKDYAAFLSGCTDKFDIVFLDPPYAAGIVPTVLEKIMPNLKDTSVVICETGNDILDSIPSQYEVVKNVKYGIAYVTVLRFNGGN